MKRPGCGLLGRIKISPGAASVLVAVPVFIGLGVYLLAHWRAFHADLSKVRASFYESWRRENAEAYGRFTEAARTNNWIMYVGCSSRSSPSAVDGGIGYLDCGQPKYTALYAVPRHREIVALTRFFEAQAAFIECNKGGHGRGEHFELGVVSDAGLVLKAEAPLGHGDKVGAIAISQRHVFFTNWANKGWLYRIADKALDTVFELPLPDGRITKAHILEETYLLILSGSGGEGRFRVIRATGPYTEVSTLQGVSNVEVVGGRIIVERDAVCFLYDPRTGSTEQLVPGKLVSSLSECEFLFRGLEQYGLSYSSSALYRYDLLSRSADIFWDALSADTGSRAHAGQNSYYAYNKLVLSPDGRFLLVPLRLRARSYEESRLGERLQYEVYDLRARQQRGAFLNLHEGEFFFQFLGWADTGRGTTQTIRPEEP